MQLALLREHIDMLETIYENIKKDLITIGNFLNKKNLNKLSENISGFELIKKDISCMEEYLGDELGPINDDGEEHKKETGKILNLLLKKRNQDHIKVNEKIFIHR